MGVVFSELVTVGCFGEDLLSRYWGSLFHITTKHGRHCLMPFCFYFLFFFGHQLKHLLNIFTTCLHIYGLIAYMEYTDTLLH
jgi:hypothetical protein